MMKEELTETSPRATDLLLEHLAGQKTVQSFDHSIHSYYRAVIKVNVPFHLYLGFSCPATIKWVHYTHQYECASMRLRSATVLCLISATCRFDFCRRGPIYHARVATILS